MRYIFSILFCVIIQTGFSQIVKTVGYSYTNGTPTYTPARAGSALALDTVTWRYYTWNGSTWLSDGFRVQTISGCSAPAYTPTKYQSLVVINACNDAQGGPEIYKWSGSVWEKSGGTNYTAGAGISIDGSNVISNTSPNIVQTLSIAGQDLTLSGGGGTVEIPAGPTVSGASGQIGVFSGTTAIGGSNNLFWNGTNLGVGISASLAARLHILGTGTSSSTYSLQIHDAPGTSKTFSVRDDAKVFVGDLLGSAKFNVTGTSSAYVSGSGATSPSIWYLRNANVNGLGGFYEMYTNADVAPDFFGKFGWRFNGGTNTAAKQMALFVSDGSTPKMVITGAGFNGFGTESPTSRIDAVGAAGYNQFRLRTSYTPTSTADALGNTGDTAWNDNYFYIKTSAGWKRTALSTF